MAITKEQTKVIARLNIRLPADVKDKIEQAAIVSGVSLTDFTIANLSNSADEVLDRVHSRKLSDRDRDLFLSVLDSNSEPDKALVDAFKAHQELISK